MMKKIKAVLSFSCWLVMFSFAILLMCILTPLIVFCEGLCRFWQDIYTVFRLEVRRSLFDFYRIFYYRSEQFKQDYHGTD